MAKLLSDFKIGLCGPQNSGKTTLMKLWSEQTGTKIVQAETRKVMEEFGYSSQIELQKASPEKRAEFQKEIIERRDNLFFETEGGFISDRTILDSFVYFAIHESVYCSEHENYFKNILIKSFDDLDIFVFLQPEPRFEDNGLRSTSPLYYETVKTVMNYFLWRCISSIGIWGRDRVLSEYSDNIEIDAIILNNSRKTMILIIDESKSEEGISTPEIRFESIKLLVERLLK